jgi:hypothetical protein
MREWTRPKNTKPANQSLWRRALVRKLIENYAISLPPPEKTHVGANNNFEFFRHPGA